MNHAKPNKRPKLLNHPAEIVEMVNQMKGESVIGVDTEFIRETTFFPRIALIQVATASKVWLVDPTALTKEELLPLLEVFQDPEVLKVVHASYADQECLYWAYGIIAEPVLDTSVAAALCGNGDNIGLQKLLKEELDVVIPKGRSRVKWLARPLSDELLVYAEEDVLHLVELFRAVKRRLDQLNRYEWALAESKSEPAHFDTSPEELAAKMGRNINLDPTGRSALLELVRWREGKARSRNIPRNWIADNEVLLSLARARPKNAGDLKSFRGLNVKEVERSGEEILGHIRAGIEIAKDLPREEREFITRLPEVEAHLIDFVQSYISFLARQHSIATRFIMNVPKMTHLIRNTDKTPAEWIEKNILTHRAAELVGNDLKQFLMGEKGLVIRAGEVTVVKL